VLDLWRARPFPGKLTLQERGIKRCIVNEKKDLQETHGNWKEGLNGD
jgi:hypothetical protein